MKNRKYEQYKIHGLCRRCGLEPLPDKTRCEQCHKKHLQYTRNAKEKAKANGICRYCLIKPVVKNKSMCKECLVEHSNNGKKLYAQWREDCINAYGGCCKCCTLNVRKYLQLDHIFNDGAKHRKTLTKTGRGGSLYKWAVKNNFPPNLQLLCANCHQAKTTSGGCSADDHKWNLPK